MNKNLRNFKDEMGMLTNKKKNLTTQAQNMIPVKVNGETVNEGYRIQRLH